MSRGGFVPELPCERLVRKICGPQWRSLPKPEIDAAWGVAIVSSFLNGVRPQVGQLANHLGVDGDQIIDAYNRLNMNGIFKGRALQDDRKLLEGDDMLAWGYYGGYAAGATGVAS